MVQLSPPSTSGVASSCKPETRNLLNNVPSPSTSPGNYRPTLHGPDSRDLVEAESYSTCPFVTGQFMQHGVHLAHPYCSCIKVSSFLRLDVPHCVERPPAVLVLLDQGWGHNTAAAETGWKEVRK